LNRDTFVVSTDENPSRSSVGRDTRYNPNLHERASDHPKTLNKRPLHDPEFHI